MLAARFARIEFDAHRTAREIQDRRELLDWHLNARRQMEAHKANEAAAREAEANTPAPVLEAPPSAKGCGRLRSSSASRIGAEVVASPSKTNKPGSRSMLTMPSNTANSMHQRVNVAVAAAQRNARELSERRVHLDQFKDIQRAIQEAKNKDKPSSFSMSDPLPTSTYKTWQSHGHVQRLSFNSRLSFAENYALQPLDMAMKEIPPPHPVHPTSSMNSRLEACEHRVLWNHQTMTHNQNFLDDYRRFASA